MPKISIIIPTFNEERYIAHCLESILQSNYDKAKMEILVVDGGSKDETTQIVSAYHERFISIRVIDNPTRYTPTGMNLGIEASSGEYLFIISAHAFYPKTYFSQLVSHAQRLNAACVGGVLDTEVKHKNKKSNAIKRVLSHPLGVGNATFRIGSDEVKEVDTVPFGCYQKEVFKKYGLYDTRLIRNQDIELNKRILRGGGKIYLIPDVRCTYYARETFGALAKNSYENGFWNILTAYYTKTLDALSLRHFIPLLFLLSLILPFIGALLFTPLMFVTLFSLVSYLCLVIIISFKIKEASTSLGYLIMAFLTLHLSYGWGSLMGVVSVFKKYIKGEK